MTEHRAFPPIPRHAHLPDWPRLMDVDLAAAYLGIGASTLRATRIEPVRHGRRVLYDRRDLDRWADALAGQPLDEPARAAETDDVARRVRDRLSHAMP